MNRERRKESGKVFLDLSKYLATTIAISGLFSKESVNRTAVLLGVLFSVVLFVIGVKTIPIDKGG